MFLSNSKQPWNKNLLQLPQLQVKLFFSNSWILLYFLGNHQMFALSYNIEEIKNEKQALQS